MHHFKALALILSFFTVTPAAFAGAVSGGGGDQYALSFVETAHSVLTWLQSNPNPYVSPSAFAEAIKTTEVVSVDRALSLAGLNKDAINYPSLKKIELSRPGWDRLESANVRNALVFHEYLGIMGVDDSRYQISGDILRQVGVDRVYTSCAELPRSQQSVFKVFNLYLKTGSMSDGFAYLGALAQYQEDIEEFGDARDPNFGNRYDVSLYESLPSGLCTDVRRLERKVLAGDAGAIEFFLLYSAQTGNGDGAGAGDIGEVQDKIRKKYPDLVKQAQRNHAAFFARNPLKWVSEQ